MIKHKITIQRGAKMIAFHIDMNVMQFSFDYLSKWLKSLSEMGYDTVLWEVENNIQWETCPECVSPDAFSKERFKELLRLCKDLNLQSIPLLQIIGHCEYVLKHDAYKHLSESSDRFDQYCPLNPELAPFLGQWINEYLELFGKVNYFHLGADEAWTLGNCPKCSNFAQKASLSELYIQHVNTIANPIIEKGITPIIWCDMALKHNEALEKLNRKIMIFDWQYGTYRGSGKFLVWGKGVMTTDTVSQDVLDRFGDFIFPHGQEPGSIPETFYTSDFLAFHGFQTVTCPSSCFWQDNFFAPRNLLHLRNCFDFMKKGLQAHLAGTLLTSWTVHLVPWELQFACIAMPEFITQHPAATLEEYKDWFIHRYFKFNDGDLFWKACGLLSKPCLFTNVQTLGQGKHTKPIPLDHAKNVIQSLKKENKLEEELKNAQTRLCEYKEALELFETFKGKIKGKEELIELWMLSAKNGIHRAEMTCFFIETELGLAPKPDKGKSLLDELAELKKQTETMYTPIVKQGRRKEMIDWIFAAVQHYLEELIRCL
jgi:hypothetical protein